MFATSIRLAANTGHSVAASPSPSKLKRFWKVASVTSRVDGYSIDLDGRQLKTPSGITVRIPIAKKPLALLTAFEWYHHSI
jgi:chaperone required for assembly of F1-ATPase